MKKYRILSCLPLFALLISLCALPAAALDDPAANCGAAVVVDGDYGDVLYDHNAHEKMYPASITKVMTSLLVMEAIADGRLSLTQELTASPSAVTLPEGSSTADPAIQAGEILTVEELLYCDLVTSANEACNILAETVGGSVSGFVDMMNDKAQELGMTGTHFANPNGLHDENHYTTAYDVYLMSRAAMEYELFRTIVSTAKHVVPATNLSGERTLHTTNALLDNWKIMGYTYSKAIGIKTGFTTPAGYCLSAAAVDSDGRTFYCVVLGAETVKNDDGSTTRYSFREAKRLLEWAFDNFKRITLLDESDTRAIREVPVTLSDDSDHVTVQPSGSIEATMPKDYDAAKLEFRIECAESVEAPVEQGQKLGTVTLVYDGVTYGTLDMTAAYSVSRSDFLYYVKTARDYLSLWWVKALLVLAFLVILYFVIWLAVLRPRNRRRRRYSRTGARRYSGRR